MAETLGALIEATRLTKGMTVAELTMAAGISAATYRRLRHDQTDLKLNSLVAVLDALRLTLSDVAPIVAAQYTSSAQWQTQIATTARAVTNHKATPTTLVTLQGKLTAISDEDTRRLLVQYIQLLQAENADNQGQTVIAAVRLWHMLMRCGRWSHFEYLLVLPVLRFLDWSQVQETYTKHFQPLAPTAFEALINSAYLAMLDNALVNGNPVAVATVSRWFQTRCLPAGDLSFCVDQRLAELIDAWLAGEHDEAQAAWEKLRRAVQTLFGEADADLDALWQRVQRISALATPIITGRPVALHHQADCLVTWLDDWRKAKQKSVTALQTAMGISRAAYYRQLATRDKLKADTFFAAMGCLRLDEDDIACGDALLGFQLSATRQAIQQDITAIKTGTSSTHTLAEWQTQLEAKAAHNVGYGQLAEWLAVMQAEVAASTAVAAMHAIRLYRKLSAYATWTTFEYALILPVLPYLAFAQSQHVFEQYLDFKHVRLPNVVRENLEVLYLGLLASAINDADPSAVKQVLSWIKTHQGVDIRPRFKLYQRLADALLTHSPATLEAVLAAVDTVLGQHAEPERQELAELWHRAWTLLASVD